MSSKKIIISIFLMVLSFVSITAAQETTSQEDSLVRFKFGASKEEIKNVEKDSKLVFENDVEIYFNKNSEIMGPCQNIYQFDSEGKMNAVVTIIATDHKDLSNYIADYNKINKALTDALGTPYKNLYSTKDQDLLNNPTKLAESIKEGNIAGTSIWNNKDFSIVHILCMQIPTNELKEEDKKVMIVTPIAHMVVTRPRSSDEVESVDEAEMVEEGEKVEE